MAHCEQALRIYRELGDRLDESKGFLDFADIQRSLGNFVVVQSLPCHPERPALNAVEGLVAAVGHAAQG